MTRRPDAAQAPTRPFWRVRTWELWSLPRPGLHFMLVVQATAIAALGLTLIAARPTGVEFARLGLLAGLAALYTETAERFARLRLWLGNRVRADHLSVWTLAAALLVPAGYAGVLVCVGYVYLMFRCGHMKGLKPHREVFTASTAVLGVLCASASFHAIAESSPHNQAIRALAIVTALIVSTFLSLVVLTLGIVLVVRPPSLRAVLPHGDTVGFEIATLILGAIAADLVQHSIWLTPLIVIPLGVLQRSMMVTALEVEAGTDDKTGLLNAGAWRKLAERQLTRSERDGETAALLLIDLDHFKKVNDTHGHLAGDAALRALADCLRSDLRGYDAVGRYGGEEFVIQLPGVDLDSATAIAQRLVERIRELDLIDDLRLTASIGVAPFPDVGSSLDELIAAADVALYAAKQGGRNQVQVATAPAHVPMRTAS